MRYRGRVCIVTESPNITVLFQYHFLVIDKKFISQHREEAHKHRCTKHCDKCVKNFSPVMLLHYVLLQQKKLIVLAIFYSCVSNFVKYGTLKKCLLILRQFQYNGL